MFNTKEKEALKELIESNIKRIELEISHWKDKEEKDNIDEIFEELDFWHSFRDKIERYKYLIETKLETVAKNSFNVGKGDIKKEYFLNEVMHDIIRGALNDKDF